MPIRPLRVAVMNVIICCVVLIQKIPVNAIHVKTAIVHGPTSTNCKLLGVSGKEHTGHCEHSIRMRKTLLTLILVLTVILSTVNCFASSASELNTADARNELGLFLGTGTSYDLDGNLTRAQGVTLLVRMIGMEKAAESGSYQNSFVDVPEWAKEYIGYAFDNNITKGTSATTFSPDEKMTDYMFLTLVIRALGYSDSGDTPLFTWDEPYELAWEIGLIDQPESDKEFTRADAITVFWNALDARLNGVEKTLADRLIEQGIFTSDELTAARETQKNGRKENAGAPIAPDIEDDAPSASVPDSSPENGSSPEPVPDPTPEPDSGSDTEIEDGGEWT